MIYDALLVICLYLCFVNLPALPGVDQASFTAFLRFLVLLPIVYYLMQNGFIFQKPSLKNTLICLPLCLICFGNLTSLLFFQKPSYDSQSDLLRLAIYTLGTAAAEELVFRFAFIQALEKTKAKPFAILISAAVFGCCHFFALLGGASFLSVLAQVGYTFLLGLLLGVAYLLGGLLPAILLHFFFNFLQTDIYLALGGGTWDLPFYLCNIVCFLLATSYAAFLLLKNRSIALRG